MNDETKQAVSDAVEKTVEAAEEAVQRPGVQSLARLGFYTKGFLFLVIGGLALMLVFGIDGGQIAGPTGALALVAERPFGTMLLIVFFAGAIGHGIWNILRGLADVDDVGRGVQGIVRRGIAVGLGLFYIGLAISAFEIVSASRITDENVGDTFMALLLAIPLGFVVVALIGLGVIIAGLSECYSGVSGKFRENYRQWEITGAHLFFINVLGIISFSARALLLVIMGGFFVRAAIDEPDGSIGIDSALLTLLQSGYGRAAVLLAAIGLIGHGILAFYEARYRRIC